MKRGSPGECLSAGQLICTPSVSAAAAAAPAPFNALRSAVPKLLVMFLELTLMGSARLRQERGRKW